MKSLTVIIDFLLISYNIFTKLNYYRVGLFVVCIPVSIYILYSRKENEILSMYRLKIYLQEVYNNACIWKLFRQYAT